MRILTLIALTALMAAPLTTADLNSAKAQGIETGAAGSFRLLGGLSLEPETVGAQFGATGPRHGAQRS
jgi:hypothetical protein